MSKHIVKKDPGRDLHFTKDFGDGTASDRLILPGADECAVKVTRFKFARGFKAAGVRYDCDETVVVMWGRLGIDYNDGERNHGILVTAGELYHVPAGVSYSVEAQDGGMAICVFSPSTEGVMPEDEAPPS